MIDTSLNFIAASLNKYFKNLYSLNEEMVVVSNLINADGSVPPITENKVVLTFINIDPNENDPSNSLGFYMLVSFNFNYLEGLKFLSEVVSFFKGNSTCNKTAKMGDSINKITLEL